MTKKKDPACVVMDPRCPRKLKQHPRTWCPLGVLRLKALRNADHELTDEELITLSGCPWSINHQMSNYCFFKYAKKYLDRTISDIESAHMNNISAETVKKTIARALDKLRDSNFVKDIAETHASCAIVDEKEDYDPYSPR